MYKSLASQLEQPRFETVKPLLIAGLQEHYTSATMKRIPVQWEQFAAHIDNIAVRVGRHAYGVRFNTANSSDGFDYLAGVEVSRPSSLSGKLSCVRIPAQEYAVFHHHGPVSKLRNTIHAVFNDWLPDSGLEIASLGVDGPKFLERYGKGFDIKSEMGDVEIWVPIKK